MLDPNALSQLVQQEIQTSVQREVDAIVRQTDWIAELERQIVDHVQDRITARFSNIATVPDLVSTVEHSVETLFKNGFVPNIKDFVKEKTIRKSIDIAVENFVTQTLDNLTVDSEWVNKIQNLVNQTMVDKLKQNINGIDVNQTLTDIVLQNQDALVSTLKKDFSTQGIKDQATDLQLTVMDEAVVVENELHTNDLSVERNTILKGDLSIDGNLAIKGRVNVDNQSWQELAGYIEDNTFARMKSKFETNLIETVLSETKRGIDFDNVTIDGEYLVSSGKLSAAVTKSNIQELGTLESLTVSDSLSVARNRVGINTARPDSALSIWDEEVSLSAGKHSANTGYIGTSKKQDFVLGTNKQSQLSISADGGVWIESLTVDKNNIGHTRTVPNHSGTKGDILFNIDHKPGTPFAWICLGNYRWNELRSAE